MRVVAIATGDARSEHLALLERAVIVDFIEHLPVGVIEPSAEHRDDVGVGEPLPGNPIFGKLPAACMAQPASFDLLAQIRLVRCCAAGWPVSASVPATSSSFRSSNRTRRPIFGIVALAEGPPALFVVRPGDMTGALSVAGLAADADL